MSIVQIAGVELLSRMLSLEATRRAVPSSRAKVLYVCACVYAQCVYMHIYTYTYPCMYINICMHMYIYLYPPQGQGFYVCVYVNVHKYTFVYTSIYICVYMNTNGHILISTYIFIYRHSFPAIACARSVQP